MSATTRAFQFSAVPTRRETSTVTFPGFVGRVMAGVVITALFAACIVCGVTAARTVVGPTLESSLIHLVHPNFSGPVR